MGFVKKLVAISVVGTLVVGLFAPVANALPGDLVYESTIGQPAVNLWTTSAIASDSQGNYYALSYKSGDSKVTKYTADHQLILEFGSSGTDDGQFESTYFPWGIYVDPDDNVWVADTGNHRFQKFDSNGNFLLKIGGTTAGTSDTQFNTAYGMAFTDDGYVWIGDRYNNRLQKFDLNGNFITKITNAEGAGLNQPHGVYIDATGNIYVASRNNHRLQKYDADGNYLMTFGTGVAGAGDGQLREPTTVLVDPSNGDVYTYEIYNKRISVFNAAGTFLRNFSVELPSITSHRSFSMIWELNGNITLALQSAGTNKIQTITKTGELVNVFNGTGIGVVQVLPTLFYGSIDPFVHDGRVYVTDPQGGRFVAYTTAGEYVTESHYVSRTYVTATALDGAGNVYVLDYLGLHKYTQNGEYINQVLTAADTGYNLQAGDVAVDVNGDIWITGSGTNNQVRKFSASGALLATIGSYGTGNGELSNPTSIALTQDELYVVEAGNNRVQVFDRDGNYIRQFGTFGSGNGELDQPYGIALDDKGDVYVSDRGNNRIQKFTANGTYLTQFGSQGSGDNEFDIPMGLTFAGGKLYVGDAGNGRVQVLSVAPDVPSEPLDLSLSTSNNKINISWETPTDDGGSPITQYTIRYRAVGTDTWITIGTTDSTVFSATITGLPDGEYEVQVFASNVAGDGRIAMSGSVTVTANQNGSSDDSEDVEFVPGAPDTGGAVDDRIVKMFAILAGISAAGLAAVGVRRVARASK